MATGTTPKSGAGARYDVRVDPHALDQIFAAFDQCQAPGVAVGVALEGRAIYRKGFGLANMEQAFALTPATRMRIASLTKHFTCFAYLLLCEDGKASFSDTIGDHVLGLAPHLRDARIDDIMAHISGLRDAEEILHQLNGTAAAATIDDILGLYRRTNDRSAPAGATWRYNNGGYLLLGRAIENISGCSLAQVFLERIFEPLGMSDTFLRPWNSDFRFNSAVMHMSAREGGFVKDYINHEHGGEGGLVSTIDDMLRWMAHMDAPVLGSPETWRAMCALRKLTNGVLTGYASGLMVGTYRGAATIGHSGGLMGAKAHMLKFPDARFDIIVLANRHDVSPTLFTHQIADACLSPIDPIAAEADRAPAEGVFASAKSGRVITLQDKRGRQMVCLDGLDFAMARQGAAELRHLPVVAQFAHRIELHGDPTRPHALELNDFGSIDHFDSVGATPPGDFAAVAGAYRSEAAQATIAVSRDGIAVSQGAFATATFDLEWLAPQIARARARANMPWGGILRFTPEHLLFSTFTTPQLPFERVSTT